jgi:undecaprenyl-phosphate 4-deoxy-4-formamido-L-arabinose transferase
MISTDEGLDISVVIPVYGSASILPRLADSIEIQLGEFVGAGNFELILVHDCGPDDAWRVITELAGSRPWLRGINLAKNMGQHNAIMAGLGIARGTYVITMDDDLQHDPADIPRIVSSLQPDYDLCYVEFESKRHALWKRVGSRVNGLMARVLLGKPKGLYLSPYRGIRKGILGAVLRYDGPFVYLDGLLLQATSRIATISAKHHARSDGASGYSFRKSLSLWLKMATSFSTAPLRLVSLAGIVGSMLAFVFAIVVFVQKMLDPAMAMGWPSLIISVFMVGSLQLLALGAIGEYIGRILITTNKRPQYVVHDSINTSLPAKAARHAE